MTARDDEEARRWADRVGEAARRRQSRDTRGALWHGLKSLIGVGWLIVLPALGGALIGRAVDAERDGSGPVSWSLTGILIGIAIGVAFAWHAVGRELVTKPRDEEDGAGASAAEGEGGADEGRP